MLPIGQNMGTGDALFLQNHLSLQRGADLIQLRRLEALPTELLDEQPFTPGDGLPFFVHPSAGNGLQPAAVQTIAVPQVGGEDIFQRLHIVASILAHMGFSLL